ncbi:hypothetical protein [Variovorax sp. HW608]|uniref:hypothetical protein n=1 Tax=Variovorax sp. HW608 TaxID=1034889 RepID=UPI0012FD67FB|nr:hypothetical protein [Variovorax sp. HW608]
MFTALAVALLANVATSADCNSLLRQGIFEFSSLNSELDKAEAVRNWYRNQSSSSDKSSGSHGGNLGYDGFSLAYKDDAKAAKEAKQDVESYNENNSSLRSRVVEIGTRVNVALAQEFNKCLSTPGLHAWVETSSDPFVFTIAMKYVSDEDRFVAPTLKRIKVYPSTVTLLDGDKVPVTIGGNIPRWSYKRANCQEAVTVFTQASKAINGASSLSLPSFCPPKIEACNLKDQRILLHFTADHPLNFNNVASQILREAGAKVDEVPKPPKAQEPGMPNFYRIYTSMGSNVPLMKEISKCFKRADIFNGMFKEEGLPISPDQDTNGPNSGLLPVWLQTHGAVIYLVDQ